MSALASYDSYRGRTSFRTGSFQRWWEECVTADEQNHFSLFLSLCGGRSTLFFLEEKSYAHVSVFGSFVLGTVLAGVVSAAPRADTTLLYISCSIFSREGTAVTKAVQLPRDSKKAGAEYNS